MLLKRDGFLQTFNKTGESELINYSLPSKKTYYSMKEGNIEWKIIFRHSRGRAFLGRLLCILHQKQKIWNKTSKLPKSIIVSQATMTVDNGDSLGRMDHLFTKNDRRVGVAGLEKKNEDDQQKNEDMINNAFTDLYMLMLSAEQVLAFANNYQKTLKHKAFSSEDYRKPLGQYT